MTMIAQKFNCMKYIAISCGVLIIILQSYDNISKSHEISSYKIEKDVLLSQLAIAHGLIYQAQDNSQRAEQILVDTMQWLEEQQKINLQLKLVLYIKKVNPRAPANDISLAIMEASERYGIDPIWIAAQMEQESHFNPRAVGQAGERGLMQIMRPTALSLGLQWDRAFNIDDNINAGVLYMAQHVSRYQNYDKALSRYNGGNQTYAMLVSNRYNRIKRYLST